jgi:hypothetical protein
MKIRILLTLVTFCLTFCIFSPVGASAQNVTGLLLTVNNNGDSFDANPGDLICADLSGQCTLRAAIEETNAIPTRDAIIFSLPQPAVIELTLGELLINQNLDILGPGARRLTIRRATSSANFRIFHIPATQALVNIRGLSIRNGNDLFGGGIFVETGGVLGLFDSAVSGNSAQIAGGIYSSGTVIVHRCLIDSNSGGVTGGALANVGSAHEMTVAHSTITGNSASSAGAVYNEGTLLLVNDTISGNTGTQAVNGILNTAQGTVRVINTIIGRDTALGNTLQGAFVSGGNNIVTNSNGSTGFTNGVNGDQISTNNIIDPLLGPLADNGGQTNTFTLMAGSPAIKGGNACAMTGQCPLLPGIRLPGGRLDQRRFRRNPFAEKIDVGALDTDSSNGSSVGTVGVFGVGPGMTSRFVGSHAYIIHPTTLETRHTLVRLTGGIIFNNVPGADVYVIEIRSKRSGMSSPLVISFDF